MFNRCNLAILILAMSLNGQVCAIFAGRAVEICEGNKTKHRRPYMVLLEQHGENNLRTYCGGFLLNEAFVMTAAQCQASHVKSYKVLLGLHNFHHQNGVQTVSVEKLFIHEKYNATDLKNDIMLLKLSSKAHFTEHVRPIALAEHSNDSQPESCMIFGWGKTNMRNNHLSPILMEASITLMDKEECSKENSYCSKGEVQPGPGDSGGPLVCGDGKAYGVVSTYILTNGTTIHAYVKIPDYRDWIDSVMKNASKTYM